MKPARLICLLSTLLPACAVQPLVDLGYSRFLGSALPNGVSQWLGMRYAAPPLGNLRFRAPQDPPLNRSIQIADQVRQYSYVPNPFKFTDLNFSTVQYASPRAAHSLLLVNQTTVSSSMFMLPPKRRQTPNYQFSSSFRVVAISAMQTPISTVLA